MSSVLERPGPRLMPTGRPRAVAQALLALTLVTGCSGRDEPPETTGVPDVMVEDARSFLMPDGLFRLPEAPGRRGSVFATAQLAPFLPQHGLFDWDLAARSAYPSGDDLASLWAYVTIVRCSGDRPDKSRLMALWKAVALPDPSEPGAEIGVISTYAEAYAALRDLGAPVHPSRAVLQRLGRLVPADVSDAPYLVWRVRQAAHELGVRSPLMAGLPSRFQDLGLTVPTDDRGWLDTQALVALYPSRGTPEERARLIDAAARVATSEVEDPAIRASALDILTVLRGSVVDTLREALLAQVDPSTGLLRDTDPVHGQLTATYLFAKLLDSRFAEVATPRTRSALYSMAADRSSPAASRLTAAVGLRKAGDGRWHEFIGLARAAAGEQPRSVSREALADYLAVLQPAVDLDAAVRKATFHAFAVPRGDELAQRDALAAINSAYLFNNAEEPVSSFDTTRSQLEAWATSRDGPLARRVAAGAALAQVRGAGAQPGLIDAVGAQLRSRRGCAEAKALLSTDLSQNGTCSLALTLQAKAIPGFLS